MVAHRRAALAARDALPAGGRLAWALHGSPGPTAAQGVRRAREPAPGALVCLSLSCYCTRLEPPARALGSVDLACPGLTAPGALPLAQRLQLPPGPTTVVAPTPKPYVAWARSRTPSELSFAGTREEPQTQVQRPCQVREVRWIANYNRSKYKATQQRPTAKTPSARRACGAGGDEVSTDTNG